ncbi:C4-dicarboxylate TRAP transporter substrate-binding protein [Tritonibacter horizontis]|nr:C4-dicarboxylate TRAP transporter substrate-binding protein [Tritonibacter horizontis]
MTGGGIRMNMLKTLLATAALTLGTGAMALAETTIFYGHAGPPRGTVPAALNWVNDRLAELTDGEVKMDIQWGGALFKAPSAVQSIGDGVADAGSIISAYFPKEMAGYALADLPLGGPDPWVGMRATDRMMRLPEMTEHLAAQNLVYVGTFTASDVNVACKGGEINSIADIAGKKVRGAGVYGKVFGELGATMVNLSVYEAYQGLDTGLIDCTQGYSYIIPALKWHEQIDSYTVLNWGQIGGYGMFFNKQIFDSYPDEVKAALVQVGEELPDKFAQIVIGANEKAITTLREGGYDRPIKLIEAGGAEAEALNAAAQPFIAEWKETAQSVGLDPEALMKVYGDAVVEYTADLEANGYPWLRN